MLKGVLIALQMFQKLRTNKRHTFPQCLLVFNKNCGFASKNEQKNRSINN
jgi:hypothetical protein